MYVFGGLDPWKWKEGRGQLILFSIAEAMGAHHVRSPSKVSFMTSFITNNFYIFQNQNGRKMLTQADKQDRNSWTEVNANRVWLYKIMSIYKLTEARYKKGATNSFVFTPCNKQWKKLWHIFFGLACFYFDNLLLKLEQYTYIFFSVMHKKLSLTEK